jgi:hypothetical protein
MRGLCLETLQNLDKGSGGDEGVESRGG